MAVLTLRNLTCNTQEDWTGDDRIEILVDGRRVWGPTAMDTGQTRNLGDIQVDFDGTARVVLIEKDIEGDDNLGTVTVGDTAADSVGRFTQDDADYSLSYRVTESETEDDEWWEEDDECSPDDEEPVCEDPNYSEPSDEDPSPSGNSDPDEPAEPCPMGNLMIHVQEDDGTPVAGAAVTVEPLGMSGATDEDGNFDAGQVEEGVYTITARKDQYVPDPATTEVTVPPDATTVAELVLNYSDVAVAIVADDVACPGHRHQVRASANPPGGTFTWTIDSGSATLFDGSDASSQSGDTLFLRGITPEEVRLTVTYTVPEGTATASKTITIHGINYRVRNFIVAHGGFQAHESAGAVRMWDIPGRLGISLDPTVQIRLDASCPRKTACATNHRVGWLQVMRVDTRELRYPTTRFWVTCPMPIRDAWRNTIPPFYDGPSVQTFTDDRNTQTAHHEDSPSYPGPAGAPWVDPRSGAGDLETITLADQFTAWLVVQNIEWANDISVSDSFTYLKHLAWRCALTSTIDVIRPVGSRATPRRRNTAFAAGDGRGSDTPIFTAPIFNTRQVPNRDP